uniref:Uncharacterized protein n=1 Tax=Echeneis naucrates TaxID=173247 RepID=A0A665UTK3_ECHNA
MCVVFTLPESRLLALILLTWDSAISARSSASSSSCWIFLHLDRLKFLELLLATLHGQVLSLIQAVLQVLDSDLQVLLHPLQVILGSDSIIKVQLINDPLAVPLDLLHLLIFFCQLPVHLTLNLVELQLDAQDLGLFVFQGSLLILKNKKIIHALGPSIMYQFILPWISFFLQIENVPQPPQELSGSHTSLSPPASWPSPAHGCSCQSHQSVQSDLRSPLQRDRSV